MRWLSTPKLMAALALLAALGVLTGYLLMNGQLGAGQARVAWSVLSLMALVGVVLRARAHWDSWRDRQLRQP